MIIREINTLIISFTITSKRTKYLGINLIKEMKGLSIHIKKRKILMEESEDANKKKDNSMLND